MDGKVDTVVKDTVRGIENNCKYEYSGWNVVTKLGTDSGGSSSNGGNSSY